MKLIAGFAVIVALLSGWGVISMAQSSKVSLKQQDLSSENSVKNGTINAQESLKVQTSAKVFDPKESEKKVNTTVKIAE